VVLFSWLSEVVDSVNALAIEVGPCSFTEVRGLLGCSKCSDDLRVVREGRHTTGSSRG
jgi:hypothetical protein